MAYTLKLNIYNFSLYRIISSGQRQQRGRVVITYRTEDTASGFSDFIRSINPNANRDTFVQILFTELTNFFNNRFLTNLEGTRAVSITQEPQPRLYSLGYKIDGMFKGGETGIGRYVYDQSNAVNSNKRIESSDVPAVSYYYKIWMPYDAEDGILMVQSYTAMGCVSTFRDQLESFFISHGFKPRWNAIVPDGVMDTYLRNSVIDEIKIIYAVEQREAQGVFSSMRLAKKETLIKNLSIPFRQLLQLDNYQQELERHIMEFVDYDAVHDMAKVFYTDENGRKASASMADLHDILPSIILPDNLKVDGTEEPDLNEIASYTDGILENIKHQIGYTVDELQ